MIYFIDNNESATNICNEFNLFVDDIVNEANMAILATKYAFICENGYEMPINEAEEKKENIFKRMINAIIQKLRDLKEKIVKKIDDWAENHNTNKLGKYIIKIRNSHKQAEDNVKNSETPEKAKEEAKKGAEKLKNIADEAKRDIQEQIKEKNDNTKTSDSEDKDVKVAPDSKDNSKDKDVKVAPDSKTSKRKENFKNIKNDINIIDQASDEYKNKIMNNSNTNAVNYPKFAYTTLIRIYYKYERNLTNSKNKISLMTRLIFDYDTAFKSLWKNIDHNDKKLVKQIKDNYNMYRKECTNHKNKI